MDQQKILKKYTKIIAKRLYGIEIKVYFRKLFDIRAIFRDEDYPPYSIKDYDDWHKNPMCSITYEERLYKKDKLAPNAFVTLIHEVTHYEIGTTMNNQKTYRVSHSTAFRNAEKRNMRKVRDLEKLFNKEAILF